MRKLVLAALAILPLPAFAAEPVVPPTSVEIEQRVESILKQMTLEEKIDLLGGVNTFGIRGVPRLAVPPMLAADGPFGVRNFTRSTVIAGGIALAATWNSALAGRVGREMGRDARSRGVNFYLAPGVNIYRSPLNGRNFEYFGEDPYLAAHIAAPFIQGVQSQGVAATVKHYFGNNSEYARHNTDSVIDERTAREIYLPAYEAAVKTANVAAVMDAYNLVNGEHMTQNRYFNVDVLKNQWGFKGVLMSDWDGTYDALAAANGGLDLEMPSGKYFNRSVLTPLLNDGKISAAALDDKVRRILRTAARFGWLDGPQLDASIPRYNAHGRAAALQTALEGIVLLKNADGTLPLDRTKIHSIAVIGPNAYPAVPHGGGSVTVAPFHAISLLEGLSNELGTDVEVQYSRGIADLHRFAAATRFSLSSDAVRPGLQVELFNNMDLAGPPASTRVDAHIDQGAPLDLAALASGEFDLGQLLQVPIRQTSTRWTGYYTPTQGGDHDVFVQVGGFGKGIGYRLYVDDKLVANRWDRKTAPLEATRLALELRPHKIVLEHRGEAGGLDGSLPFVRLGIVRDGGWVDAAAEQFAAHADAVILAVGFDAATEVEDWDRTFQLPPGQEELIRRICAINKRCVVTITSGGAVDMTGWLERAPGLLQSWYLGQEGGSALAKILFGEAVPSGHLPATFERRWEDNPVHDSYYPDPGTNRVRYKEGVFVGYRGYERSGIAPQFPFGHGLSYTSFAYGDLDIKASSGSSGALYDVSFSVKNTGARAGAAVPQLYIAAAKSAVPRPAKELKGFTKVLLQPGESRKVVLPLDMRSFAYYDAAMRRWRAEPGDYQVLLGESTEQIALKGTVRLSRAILANP
ncbi:MAG: glycoside hydrolase family 3 C-terminal domain-containing protein [Steroidobacteraceae bacterium]